ncbi:MAG TPA: AAA family ATPase [Acidobacteriaceae bacterium]|nr:AAA family ATPase [Acidobacteriaceae bacterium]
MSGVAESPQRSILLVSGSPASGKSTLARALAEILGYPLISKDTIKESLFDSLGTHLIRNLAAPELSHLLSRAAMDLLWSLAPGCPQVILEANFRPGSAHERERFAALQGRKLEVYCHCTLEEASRRFRERATRTDHHPAHSMKVMSVALLQEYDRPIGLCPAIDVDTEAPVNPPAVVQRIRRHWPDLPGSRSGE